MGSSLNITKGNHATNGNLRIEGWKNGRVGDFFLAENSVDESVYYWVNSSNKEIFELMLHLVYLDLRG